MLSSVPFVSFSVSAAEQNSILTATGSENTANEKAIDISKGNIKFYYDAENGYCVEYTDASNTLKTETNLAADTQFVISQSNNASATDKCITVVNWNTNVLNLTLNGVNIRCACPVDLKSSKVQLTLQNSNSLSSTNLNNAALQLSEASEVYINGSGSLDAKGESYIKRFSRCCNSNCAVMRCIRYLGHILRV